MTYLLYSVCDMEDISVQPRIGTATGPTAVVKTYCHHRKCVSAAMTKNNDKIETLTIGNNTGGRDSMKTRRPYFQFPPLIA